MKNLLEEIIKNQEEGKVIGLYEKRAGGETVFLYNIQSNDMITLFDLEMLNNPLIGNTK